MSHAIIYSSHLCVRVGDVVAEILAHKTLEPSGTSSVNPQHLREGQNINSTTQRPNDSTQQSVRDLSEAPRLNAVHKAEDLVRERFGKENDVETPYLTL